MFLKAIYYTLHLLIRLLIFTYTTVLANFSHFSLFHLIPLLASTSLIIGGLAPYIDTYATVREYALSFATAASTYAGVGFMFSGARAMAIGVAMWVFYLGRNLAAVDTMCVVLLGVGVMDAVTMVRHGRREQAVFRVGMGVVIGLYGSFGMTERMRTDS